MISPHPNTTQIVAEAARKERLAALKVQRRYPGLAARGWLYVVGFAAQAGNLGGRFLARIRHRGGSHPTASQQSASATTRLAGDRLEAPLLMERRSQVPKLQLRCQRDNNGCNRRGTWVREDENSQMNESLQNKNRRPPLAAD